jgi:hypothetical protein
MGLFSFFFGDNNGSNGEADAQNQDLALLLVEGVLEDMKEQDDAPTREQFDAIHALGAMADEEWESL